MLTKYFGDAGDALDEGAAPGLRGAGAQQQRRSAARLPVNGQRRRKTAHGEEAAGQKRAEAEVRAAAQRVQPVHDVVGLPDHARDERGARGEAADAAEKRGGAGIGQIDAHDAPRAEAEGEVADGRLRARGGRRQSGDEFVHVRHFRRVLRHAVDDDPRKAVRCGRIRRRPPGHVAGVIPVRVTEPNGILEPGRDTQLRSGFQHKNVRYNPVARFPVRDLPVQRTALPYGPEIDWLFSHGVADVDVPPSAARVLHIDVAALRRRRKPGSRRAGKRPVVIRREKSERVVDRRIAARQPDGRRCCVRQQGRLVQRRSFLRRFVRPRQDEKVIVRRRRHKLNPARINRNPVFHASTSPANTSSQ